MKKLNKVSVSAKINKTNKINKRVQRTREDAKKFQEKVIWLYLTTDLSKTEIAKLYDVTVGYISQIISKFETSESEIETATKDFISEYNSNLLVKITQDFQVIEVEEKKKFFGITYSTKKEKKIAEVITFKDGADEYTLVEDMQMTREKLVGLAIDLYSQPHTNKLIDTVLAYYKAKVEDYEIPNFDFNK